MRSKQVLIENPEIILGKLEGSGCSRQCRVTIWTQTSVEEELTLEQKQ